MTLFAQILESGSAASAFLFDSARREVDWQLLVAAVPECSGASSNATFDCLKQASFDTIINATNTVFLEADEEFPFMPTIDGAGGIIPDIPSILFAQGQFAHLPFIAGTNLDEGLPATTREMKETDLKDLFQAQFSFLPRSTPQSSCVSG